MNLHTILYFTSILLTCALTGFLAWYAWRQPHVTGARSYAYMVLTESLLALTEVGAMLAGTQPQAAFWFSLRVPFTAIIPVFWLFFAMEYNGRSDWLSKPVRAALFAIPLITQVVMVTGSLHGLWLVQDVGFEKIGPFWIADTSVRIPGLWYLVHTFYSTLLLVVGAGVLVVAAWRKPMILLGQALLVSLGALTALGLALVRVFNLLPNLPFNPFVPGIGFSAACYALAIFRFQFLKHTPTQKSISRLTSLEPQEKRSLVVLVFIFILIASGLAAASTLTYQNYEKQFRAQVESQLGAISSLKADELQDWRNERLADASLFYRNENFSERVRGYLEDPQDAEAQAKLLTWMEKIAASPEYDRVFLLDPQGVERISIPAAADPDAVPAALVEHASTSLASNEIIFLDFHRHSGEAPIHLSILVPIFDAQDNQRLGVLVLRINPNVYLYPFLQRWPVPSESGETLLARRDGEDALFLNSLRFQSDAALNLRFPLDKTERPAVKAVLGQTGIVEGVDYRNVLVIADIRAVPDSPWFLVSKIDTAEVYAPLRVRLWQTILFFGALILATVVGLMLVWRQQRVLYYRGQVETLAALRVSEEKFRLAFDTSPDSVAITRAKDGMFVSVNKGFEQITGYTREDVIGKTSLEINIWKDPEDRRKIVEELRATGEVRNYEAPFLTRDGEIVGLMSAVIIELNGEPHILNITRDITERKQAEDALIQVNDRLALAQRLAGAGIWDWDLATGKLNWSPEFFHLFGLDPATADATFDTWRGALHPDDVQSAGQRINEAIRDHVPLFNEYRIVTPSGETRWIGAWGDTTYNERGEAQRMTGLCIDITERKRADEKLKESNSDLKQSQSVAHVGNWKWNLKTSTVEWSDEMFHIFGIDKDAYSGRLGDVIAKVIHPDDLHIVLPSNASEFANNKPQEYRIIRPNDGEIRHIWAQTGESILDEQGNPAFLTGIAQDITERKRAEDALRESEDKFKYVFEYSVVGKSITQFNGGMQVNKALCDMLGYSPQEMQDKKWQEITHPDDIELTQKEIDALLSAEKESTRFVKRFIHKNGAVVWVDLSSTMRRDEQHKPLYLMSAVIDITERKQAEEKLTASEVRYRRLFEAAKDGILILDAETGVVADVNPFLVEMLSFPQEEIVGKELWELGFFKDIAANKANFLELQQKEYIRYEDLPLETADGRKFRVEFVSNVYQVNHHKIVQCNIRDITERKRVEQQLAQYTEHLEEMVDERTRELRTAHEQLVRQERLAMLGQVAGSIGHELRNPLGVISNATYFLKIAQPDADDKIKEYLDIIENETRTSDKIITELLDFTRIKSLDREAVAVSELIRQTLERYPAPASVEVTLELPPGLPMVFADPQHIVQVLGNLTVNACQSMPENGKLTISASAQGDMIAIAVQDTGMGISLANMKKLFEPLFTTKTKGIGLGLPVSKKLAEANGGRIEVQSEPGQGSTFTLYLPLFKETK